MGLVLESVVVYRTDGENLTGRGQAKGVVQAVNGGNEDDYVGGDGRQE